MFLNQTGVARRLGIGRAAVANYQERYPDEAPKPAAYLEQSGGQDPVPLWRLDQVPEWLALRARRMGPQVRAVAMLDKQAREAGYDSLDELLQTVPTPASSRRGSSS